MQNIPNPLVAVYQTQLEASRRFADAIFAGTEKIDRVMIGATQRAFNDQLDLVQAMTMVRDPQRAGLPLRSGFMTRSSDDVINYQKEIVRIVAEMQNEIGRGMRAYMEQLRTQAGRTVAVTNQAAQAAAGQPSDEARAQATDALNPVTSMFSVWEAAFKEVADLAKKNMSAARSAADDAITRGAQGATNYTSAATESAVEAVDAAESAAGTIATPSEAEEGGADDREKKGSSSGTRKK